MCDMESSSVLNILAGTSDEKSDLFLISFSALELEAIHLYLTFTVKKSGSYKGFCIDIADTMLCKINL